MKIFSTYFFIIFGILFFAKPVSASFIKVDRQGKVMFKVLALEDEVGKRRSLTVTDIASVPKLEVSSQLTLSNNDGKIELSYLTDQGVKNTDISGVGQELVEIEEVKESQKVKILNQGGKFVIQQDSVSAITDYPITIDPKDKKISIKTSFGDSFLSVLPSEVVVSSLRANLIDSLNPSTEVLDLKEGESGSLQYVFSGEKRFNVLNIFTLRAPVVLSVSASNGDVLSLEQPKWVPIVDMFLG